MNAEAYNPAELVELIAQVDAENNLLRSKVLELTMFAEEAVTAQVDAEWRLQQALHELGECRSAIENSRTLRMTEPMRRSIGRVLTAVRRGSR